MEYQQLLAVKPVNQPEVRYQNYSLEPVNFGGLVYNFLGFEQDRLPASDIQSQTVEIVNLTLPNVKVVRQYYQEQLGLIGAIVRLRVRRIDINSPDEVSVLRVDSSKISEAAIQFQLKSVTTALQGKLVTNYLSVEKFPIVVQYNPRL